MEKKVSGKHSSMNGFAMMKGRIATVVLASALLLGGGLTAQAQNTAVTTCSQSAATAIPQNPNWKANAAEWQKLKGEITLYIRIFSCEMLRVICVKSEYFTFSVRVRPSQAQ